MEPKKRPSIDEIIGRTWWHKCLEAAYDWYLDHLAAPYCRRFGHSKDVMAKMSGDICTRCKKMITDRRQLKFSVTLKK